MPKVKVSEATGPVLDWMVAVCQNVEIDENEEPIFFDDPDPKGERVRYNPSANWAHGGPIIECQEIELHRWALDEWKAVDTNYQFLNTPQERDTFSKGYGPTPLVAAMRCYVTSRLGDEVEVPEGLMT